ncbi:Transglycosylase, Slt family protein [Sulfitobacter noctilucicola]|uniref:Soluble lytic murein transglycosylase-like protein n=1 Tax=Sulfitobacter noctilucicola TaxID=1342301 RepID=A0A7W6M9R4_9RHOB|nr:lytic transglycosylase domain-containing protein [Sulfitobacter noctilucicola]KIN63828.1 Transglycosylase, Slt family protein [Sulfitobacter noctilucicola]MBB4174663.1 soluble lytic murein transglycosylase-like protein [Sulfitobacter noctilucicola]
MIRFIHLALFAGALCAGPAMSEGPKPFPEFSAKRVKPPKAGSSNRITIQIDPSQQAVVPQQASASPAITAKQQTPGQYDWFWEKVSPDQASAGPGRLGVALTTLAAATRKAPTPRLQHMQDIARANGREILLSTIGTQVSPALVLAVITVESAGKSDAVSGAGAQGLMQLMPDTATRFGVTDSMIPKDNILGGVKYLNWLMEEFDRDPILVLAGYNAGEGSVRKHAGVPPFAETRDYVPKVLAAFQVAKGLCKTPPELISDGCVFAAMN